VTLGLTKSILEFEKVYALACLNGLAHYRDGHDKNFSFLLNANHEWIFAPTYDLVFSYGPGGQSMLVMSEGKNPGAAHLQALGKKYGFKNAPDILERAQEAVASWSRYAVEASVSAISNKNVADNITV
jgi:serine/threonine-protein kinase HipA